MKLSASRLLGNTIQFSPMESSKPSHFFDLRECVYEGLPNTIIRDVILSRDRALLTLEDNRGRQFQREISSMSYVTGRQGSLDYLNKELAQEVFGSAESAAANISKISSRTLRHKIHSSFEIAPDVFAIGSLTGDTLIRFALGGCVSTAHDIMTRTKRSPKPASHNRSGSPSPLERKNRALSIDLGLGNCDLWRESGLRVGACVIT